MKRRLLTPLCLLLLFGGCQAEESARLYAARVGEQTLSNAELSELMAQAVPGQDTTALRQALIEQWVANALLYDAALREGLLKDDALQLQIEQNRRALVTSAFLEHYFTNNPPTFSDADIEAYYESRRDGLRLREPYIQYRLFGAPTEVEARQARAAVTARGLEPDTLWQRWPRRAGYAVVPDSAEPERGLYAALPEVRDVLLSLRPGQTSGVFAADSAYYVAHVVARIPEGGEAQLAWVRPEITHRLQLEARKSMARRLVQTLRAEALSRNTLDVPPDSLQ